jgi:ABC-type sugar transport system ATPase subunit
MLGPLLGVDPTGSLRPGAKVVMSIRPEDLSTRATAADAVNTIEGRMTFAAFAGAAVEAELKCGETNIACLLDRDADLTPGRTVTLRAKPDACLVLPEE